MLSGTAGPGIGLRGQQCGRQWRWGGISGFGVPARWSGHASGEQVLPV